MILCVGLTTIDITYDYQAMPPLGQKTPARQQRLDLGGPAANASRVADAIGRDTTLVTTLGSGPLAAVARERLAPVTAVDVAPEDYGLPISSIVVTDDGERTVLTRATVPLDVQQLELPQDWEVSVVLHDGHLLSTSREAVERFPDAIHVLDGGSWKPGLDQLLPHLDVAVVSGDFKIPHDDDTVGTLAQSIRFVAQSHGADPTVVIDDQVERRIEIQPTTVVDSNGAGDVLHGALVAYLDQGYDAFEALQYASQIATRSVMFEGVLGWLGGPASGTE